MTGCRDHRLVAPNGPARVTSTPGQAMRKLVWRAAMAAGVGFAETCPRKAGSQVSQACGTGPAGGRGGREPGPKRSACLKSASGGAC